MSRNSFWHHVCTVDKKRIQQVRQVAKEAFEKAGTPIGDVALDFATEMEQDPRFPELLDHPEQIGMAAVIAGCLHAAREQMDATEEQWGKFLEKMKHDLPYGLRPGFRSGMRDMIKRLPKRPSTGRYEILDSPQKRKKACDLVSNYERLGDSKRVAYEKTAREMNCSARTIHRAWKDRASLRAKRAMD